MRIFVHLSRLLFLFFVVVHGSVFEVSAQSLRGSRASMRRQVEQARLHNFTFLKNSNHVQRFVKAGLLVRISENQNYWVDGDVSFPYARPAVKLFVKRLSSQHMSACGVRLVVTSLTRPKNRQPGNASPNSVHPTGMAVDFRILNTSKCREFTERTILFLEGKKVLEATGERHPPHYHVAVFPRQYTAYVKSMTASGNSVSLRKYKVKRGDSLWSIAHAYGTTVEKIKTFNNLRGSRISPGQILRIPK